MSAIKALSIWREADQADAIVLSRNDVITLLEEIRASNAELLEALECAERFIALNPRQGRTLAIARAAIAKAKVQE